MVMKGGKSDSQDFDEMDASAPTQQTGVAKKKKKKEKAGDKSRQETSPHQLPSPPLTMLGRKEELKKLSGPAAEKFVRIGLFGKSGIGKTAFGAFIARRYIDKCPHGQIYVDLMGPNSKPLPIGESMTKILSVFHPNKNFPREKGELEIYYRSIISTKKMLLFLDNASSTNQLNLLLPTKKVGMTIFTSQKILTMPGTLAIKLESLDTASATTLLLTIAPRLGAWAKEICKLCTNIPQALVLAAHYLNINTRSGPEEYSILLREERNQQGGREGPNHDTTIIACLNLTYKNLTVPEARALRKLVVFQGSFTLKAQGFICEDGDGEYLGKLTVLGLLRCDDSLGRYFMHDKVRQYLTSRITTSEKATAQKRHATYYLTVLIAASEGYDPEAREASFGLNLFDTEWVNIKAGRIWTAENMSSNADITRLCSAYTESGMNLIRLRRDTAECIQWFKSGVEAAKIIGDEDMEKNCLLNLGQAHNNLKEYDKAIEYLDEALPLCKSIRDKDSEKTVLVQLGLSAMGAKRRTQAIGYMEQYLELAGEGEGEDAPDLGVTLKTLGKAYKENGDTEKALHFLKEGLAVSKKNKDSTMQWEILESLGELLTDSENPTAATEFLEEGLVIARKAGNKTGEKKILKQLGNSYIKFGEPQRALTMFKKSLVLCQETKDIQGAGTQLMLLGDTHAHLEENEKSMSFYQKALGAAKKIKNKAMEGDVLWRLSKSHAASGDMAKALDQGKLSLEVFESINHPETKNVKEQLIKWGGETEGKSCGRQ